jgi:hypothetical protein
MLYKNKLNHLLLMIAISTCSVYDCPKAVQSQAAMSASQSLAMIAKPEGDSGLLIVTVRNTSRSRMYLSWDRYSSSKLLGQFKFEVNNTKGDHPKFTAYGMMVYAPIKSVSKPNGRPRSIAYIELNPGEEQAIIFNLSRVFNFKLPNKYEVTAVYTPGVDYTIGSVRSNSEMISIKSKAADPALLMTLKSRGLTTTYTEQSN